MVRGLNQIGLTTMNVRPSSFVAGLAILLLSFNRLFAQGTAFTYQGRLNDGSNPANGLYDFRAGIFLTNSGGGTVAGPLTNSAVVVSNGINKFTYQVVHVNAEFANQVSDHDPQVVDIKP